MSCSSCLGEFEFSPEDIEQTASAGGLLSMEIECSLLCNFRCRYCYVHEDPIHRETELTPAEMRDVIGQAKALGARKIIILGGEPMIYPGIMDLVRFVGAQGLQAEIFTNGTCVSEESARQLADEDVRVVLKMNSFDPEVQNYLAGNDGAFDTIQSALANLKKAGYLSAERFLAISTVICRQNIEELPRIWAWAREQQIEPYIEMMTPQGHAWQNKELDVSSERIRQLFEQLAEMDRTTYGRTWTPQPPLTGNKCLRHQYSCLVSSTGDVMPCVGVTIPVGNIRENKLADIIQDSEVIQDLRRYRQSIKGPCAACEKASHCYGCRGAAYQLTGDYLASDPLCWHNQDRQDQISCLPVPVEKLVPQRGPMCLIKELLSVGERGGVVRAEVPADSLFVDGQGRLDEVAFFEMVAQAAAAYEGFRTNRFDGRRIQGYLLGARKFKIHGSAYVGDVLTINATKQAQLGEFAIIRGEVHRDTELLAEGEIKLWHT
ncbi:MAG: radical SAM protein [Spartobacteria bacterium]|nr:radical SAM protein [Spartobacteria bacterium]